MTSDLSVDQREIVFGAQHRLPDFDYADSTHTVFITIRARRGTVPFTDTRLASEVIAALHWLRRERGVRLYAFALMPDHPHLLLRLGEGSPALGAVIGSFKAFIPLQRPGR